MASAGKINVKNVLDSLCKILDFAAGSGPMVPEDFRLAKLDKPEVKDKFWRLLCRLVAFLSRHNNQGVEVDQGLDSLEQVRKELVKYGYSAKQFFQGSAIPSSRLLLVTIGWLLSSQDMLELFLLDVPTYDQILEPTWSTFASGLDPHREKYAILSKFNASDEIEKLNHLKHLQLSSKQVVNGLYSAKLEKAQLTAKLREMSKDDLVLSDPVNELLPVALTRKPLGTLYKYQQQIERENEFYKSYLMFSSHEQLFWEWMETVVDEQTAASKPDDSFELDPSSFAYSTEDLKRLEFHRNVFQTNLATLGQYLDIVNEHGCALKGFVFNDHLDSEVSVIFQTALVNSTYFCLDRLSDSPDKLMPVSSYLYSKKLVDAITCPRFSSAENRLFLREHVRFLRSHLKVRGLLHDHLRKCILGQLTKHFALVQKSGVVPVQINSSNLALC